MTTTPYQAPSTTKYQRGLNIVVGVQPIQIMQVSGQTGITLIQDLDENYSIDLCPDDSFNDDFTYTLSAQQSVNWPQGDNLWARITPNQIGEPTGIYIWVQPNGVAASQSVLKVSSGAQTPISSYLTSNVDMSANTYTQIAAITVPAGNWTIKGQALAEPADAAEPVDIFISTTSAGGATSAISSVEGGIAPSQVSSCPLPLPEVSLSLTQATNYYLNGYCPVSCIILAKTQQTSAPNCSGIIAVPA